MCPAAAQMRFEGRADGRLGWRRVNAEQRFRRNNDAGQTIAALAGVEVDQGVADWRVDAGGRLDASFVHLACRQRAGELRLAFHKHPTSAALLRAAAVAHARVAKASQDVEERFALLHADFTSYAV